MCEFRVLDGVHEPLCLIDVGGRDGKRHGVAWKRVETEDGASDNAERAKSSCDELREVVTGDVLHDLAAAAGERAISERHLHADTEVAGRTETCARNRSPPPMKFNGPLQQQLSMCRTISFSVQRATNTSPNGACPTCGKIFIQIHG